MENCVQLYLQTSMFAIRRFLSSVREDGGPTLTWSDVFQIVSISCSLLTASLQVFEITDYLSLLQEVKRQLPPSTRWCHDGLPILFLNASVVIVSCVLASFLIF